MHTLKSFTITILCTLIISLGMAHRSTANVIKKDDKIFLKDRTGELWDITQAVSIGFKPTGFEFGIGKNAIRPLDSSGLNEASSFGDSGARVIGVENNDDAHAYVVGRLTKHEIANTHLGEAPIAAAY